MQLARVRRAEAGEQSLFGDRILNEVDVAIEVEAKSTGADSPHRHDRGKVALFATTHERHRGARPRRFGHAEHDVRQGNRIEAAERGKFTFGVREQERGLHSLACRLVEQRLHQGQRMTVVWVPRLGEHRTNAADAHRPPVEDSGKVVPRRAREQLRAVHQRELSL